MIGPIIGIGDYGWVFSHAEDDDKVIKVTRLPTSPEYVDDLTLTNIEQYRLFRQLENQQQSGTKTPGLPTIYHSFDGYMDRIFRSILFHRALQSDHPEARGVRAAFPMGCRYGVVIMEKLPCTYRNDFCHRDNFQHYSKDSIEYQTWLELDLQEEQIYEEMMMFLYDTGWWVRDVRDPRNRGFRIDGSPIWFDPIVVRRDARDIYDAEAQTAIFQDFNLKEYERAVESGEYFTRRHGQGLFYADSYVKPRDYPLCYLCGHPAQIEVMTAIGMRQFCGNRCLGEYEGYDYGDWDAPSIEHHLELYEYDAGYSGYEYDKQDAYAKVRCRNCEYQDTIKFEPQDKVGNRNKDVRCYDHDMIILKYMENSEDGSPGEVTIRCNKCGFADSSYSDVPVGCSNVGRDTTPVSFLAEDRYPVPGGKPINCPECRSILQYDNVRAAWYCIECPFTTYPDRLKAEVKVTKQKPEDVQVDLAIKRTRLSVIRTSLSVATFIIVLWNLITLRTHDKKDDASE